MVRLSSGRGREAGNRSLRIKDAKGPPKTFVRPLALMDTPSSRVRTSALLQATYPARHAAPAHICLCPFMSVGMLASSCACFHACPPACPPRVTRTDSRTHSGAHMHARRHSCMHMQAIDFHHDTGWCSTYNQACTKPVKNVDGVSSYRQGTDVHACVAVRCVALRCGAASCGVVRCGAAWCCVVLCGALYLRCVLLHSIRNEQVRLLSASS